MMAKPMKTLELHYSMIQFLIINVNNLIIVDLRDCDDKELLKEEDRKISKIKGISGMGR